MKYDSFDDKDYFIYGMLFGGNKINFTNIVENPNYKKDTDSSESVAKSTPATTSGLNVKQIDAGAAAGASHAVSGSSLTGNAAATTAYDWADRDLHYSQHSRLDASTFDNSSFVSRVYHSVIPSDTTYAEGGTTYDSSCTEAFDLWHLIDLFLVQHTIVAANCCPVEILRKGDIIVFSENKTNAMYFHATTVGIYVGNNLVALASKSERSTVLQTLDTRHVVLVARPYLYFNNEAGLTLDSNKIGHEEFEMDGHTYIIPVFADDYYAYCEVEADLLYD